MQEPKILLARWHTDAQTGFLYRYIISQSERLVNHSHDYYEVFLVADGCVYHTVNGITTLLKRGDLFFIRANDTHVMSYCNNNSFSIANLAFTSEICKSLFSYLDGGIDISKLLDSEDPPNVKLSENETEKLLYSLQSINTASYTDSAEKILKMKTVLFKIFSVYFSKYTLKESNYTLWFDYLCEQLNKPAVFQKRYIDLTNICGKTKEHISRTFKKNLGLTPSEYINEIRLNYAANLLKNTNISVLEISMECGFENLSWFYRKFKEKFGVTPKEFRTPNN